MKGNIAKDYGDLVRDMWKGRSRTIAPLRLRVEHFKMNYSTEHFFSKLFSLCSGQ